MSWEIRQELTGNRQRSRRADRDLKEHPGNLGDQAGDLGEQAGEMKSSKQDLYGSRLEI